MKEIYAWAPYFRELSHKIAERDERYLIDAAKRVAWKQERAQSPLLNHGEKNIDPFSFFYTVAANSAKAVSRGRIYGSLDEIFEMESELPVDLDEAFIFPIPPSINTLFHLRGEGNPELLWRLYRKAVSGFDHIDRDDFKGALTIGNVALPKLTQALFIVNPDSFLPIDKHITSLGFFRFGKPPNQVSLGEYADFVELLRNAFPGCSPLDINLFAYLRSNGRLNAHPNHCYQISTNVYNESEDYWFDFNEGNHAYTGGSGNGKYPLDKPEPGDTLLIRYGRKEGRGIGVVYRNDYQDGRWSEDKRLHVLWLNKKSASLAKNTQIIAFSEVGANSKTCEAFRNADDYIPTFELLDRLTSNKTEETRVKKPPVNAAVEHPRNRILYGPPGTGKTWHAVNHALAIIEGIEVHPDIERERFGELLFDPDAGIGQVATVTFHQNFAYEDFIEGIRPSLDGGNIAYHLHDGIFKRITKAALEEPDQRFVLIIDEINRGNIAKIFGELITLIEDSRRIGRHGETWVMLPYSGEKFAVPDNLYLVGTMNTADRSIQLLDTALRRRFTFLEMMPDPKHEEVERNIDGVDCTKMLAAMNERICALLDREHQIGHTYLFDIRDMGQLAQMFQNRIFPLLQEYFFDDWAKIKAVLGENTFVSDRKVENSRALSEFMDDDRKLYERLPAEEAAWRDPAEYISIYEEGTTDEPEDA